MKTKIAVVMLTLAVAVMFLGTPAKADKGTVTVDPIDFVYTSPCTGEDIHFTGTLSESIADSVKNGTEHVVIHATGDISGVGLTSGASYKLNVNENVTESIPVVNGHGEANESVSERIISQGGAANELIKVNVHVSIDNGVITVTRDFESDSCVG